MRTPTLAVTLLLVAAGGCTDHLDEYVDAYADRAQETCKCAYDLVDPPFESAKACDDRLHVDEGTYECLHAHLDDNDEALEVLRCRVDAEAELAACLDELCPLEATAKKSAFMACMDEYGDGLDDCPALTASDQNQVTACVTK